MYKSNQYQTHKKWNEYYPENKIIKGDGHVIHHINGDQFDNRKENLKKLRFKEHTILHHTGLKRKESTRKKISISKIGKYEGKNNPFYGKHHKKESKLKMSLAQSGEKHHLYGKKRDKCIGEKISQALKNKYENKTHYLCGRKQSEETKRKKSISMKKAWEKRKLRSIV